MKSTKHTSFGRMLVIWHVLASIVEPPSRLLAQGGSLTPPGAPAPMMKTLDQVEARTPISSAPFTISASGSYYLTGNLTVTTGNAIAISADEVTLDLNGFSISSTASPASGAGVAIGGVRRNVTVKDGHIRGTTTFSAGTFTTGGFLSGIESSASGSANLQIADVRVSNVGDKGISAILTTPSSKNMVERCSVSVCGGVGIRAGRVSDCYVDTAGGTAINGDIVLNSFGETVGTDLLNQGINGTSLVENCRGIAIAGHGVSAGTLVSNSHGTSVTNTGLIAQASAFNCQGVSTSGPGIVAQANAMNCVGTSTSGAAGISATTGTVSFSRGRRDGGTAIIAINAIGCTVVGTGTVTATNKSLGTP